MIQHFRILHILILAGSIALLGACEQTVQGMKKDFQSIKMPSFDQADQASSENLVRRGQCPEVEIVPDLAVFREFTDMSAPSETTMVSRARIARVESSCVYKNHSMTIDLTMSIEGMAGPDITFPAQRRYPYFVAVISPANEILVKEVFAAPVGYTAAMPESTRRETLRQLIPIDSRDEGAAHKIMTGFQLSAAQLDYNRRVIAETEAAERAAEGRRDAPEQAYEPPQKVTIERLEETPENTGGDAQEPVVIVPPRTDPAYERF